MGINSKRDKDSKDSNERPSSPNPLYLKINREIGRHPLDARHRGEARVISLLHKVKLE
jgi:hypothetical protein